MDESSLYFANKIRSKLKDNIKDIILFGSRARNYYDGSDYDFLIVLINKNSKVIDEIRNIEVDFLNEFDILSAALIYSEKEWEKSKKMPIGLNILREGKKI